MESEGTTGEWEWQGKPNTLLDIQSAQYRVRWAACWIIIYRGQVLLCNRLRK